MALLSGMLSFGQRVPPPSRPPNRAKNSQQSLHRASIFFAFAVCGIYSTFPLGLSSPRTDTSNTSMTLRYLKVLIKKYFSEREKRWELNHPRVIFCPFGQLTVSQPSKSFLTKGWYEVTHNCATFRPESIEQTCLCSGLRSRMGL